MTEVQHQENVIRADDGHEIQVQTWQPAGQLSGVVQLLHGLGEHSGRYAAFAQACVSRGFALVAHDHRGHGKNCDQYGYFAANDGWNRVLSDCDSVRNDINTRFSDLPVILFGHSMGSYIAQAYVIKHSPQLAGMVLSGSTWPSRPLLAVGRLIARLEAWRVGAHGYSPFLNKLLFGNFNKSFQPQRTEMDWLSRDEAEVDKYIADEFCGGAYTCQLWLDLMRGLRSIASETALRQVPADLPLLLLGGEMDPVGGDKGIGKLVFRYAHTGHQRLRVKIYPQGRHEMLNEINRDEVIEDILNWLEERLQA